MFSIFVIMNKQKTLEKLLFKTFDEDIKGADIYNHNGSMWLIFTEKRKWVVEFTKQKTLWYNYKHFTDILVLFGMELSEGDEYIKKWYEERFLFKPKIVDDSIKDRVFFVEGTINPYPLIDVTIQNGVKNSQSFDGESLKLVNKIIDDGVKHTEWNGSDLSESKIEDTIQNGVNVISWAHPIANHSNQVDDIIQNGVKHTLSCKIRSSDVVEDAIQNGVKNGVKEVYSQIIRPYLVDDVLKDGVKYMMSGSEFKNNQVEDIIKYSVKLKN